MKVRRFFNKLFFVIRNLFNFRRPVFTELDFIDLVIDDKPLFLIVWKATDTLLLKIKSPKRRYYKSEGSAVALISQTQNNLVVSIKNIWRTTRIEIDILQTHLDTKTASFLVDKIKQVKANGEVIWHTPLSTISIHLQNITILKRITGTKHLTPVLKNPVVTIKTPQPKLIKQPVLKSQQFKYTNNKSL